MSFLSDGSSIVADVKLKNIYGQKGIGIHQLIFHVEFSLKTWNEFKTVLRNLSAEVFVIDSDKKEHLLGIALPENPFVEKTPDRRDTQAYSNLRMVLTSHQVELIEELRKGKDFRIKLNISCELNTKFFDDRHDINLSQREEIPKIVNQSEWISVLEQMEFGKYLLFEIPFPDELDLKIPTNLRTELVSAQEHFYKGHYDVTISKSRKVLELLANLLNDGSMISESIKFFKGTKNEREAMSKKERFYLIRKAILHYTHLAVHSEKDGNVTQFNRIEAQQILSMTISSLTYFLSEYTSKK